MIENLIENSTKPSLDFELIRNDVSKNIVTSISYAQYYKEKKSSFVIKFSILTCILCLVTALFTVKISKRMFLDTPPVTEDTMVNQPANNINPGKYPKSMLVEMFDVFVAFGAEDRLFIDEVILNSSMISEEDKKQLEIYINNIDDYKKYYKIHLGVKDGKNIVNIKHLTSPYGSFTFESTLDYDFTSIITGFENMCGKELTQDFLMSNDWDDILKVNNCGIHLYFKEVEDVYVPYYILRLDDKVYILDK